METKHRILIVDDEVHIAVLLKEGLEKLENCQVWIATSGRQALRDLEHAQYDLLITDFHMPKMDGVTLVRNARQTQPHLPVIIITAYGELISEPVATELQLTHILNKPVKLADIRAIVTQVLNIDS